MPQSRDVRRPWDKHPPWAHSAFFVVWVIAGTLGPIALLDSLIVGPRGNWWIGLSLCLVWGIDLGIDWLLVRWLRGRVDGWQPWQPPTWKSLTG
jgi:hypothetical protein